MPNQPARPLIASPRNPRIMQIRKLATRKERTRSGLFFAEGIRLVAEAIRSGSDIASLIVAPELLTSDFAHDLLARQVERDIPRLEVTAAVMQSLSARQHPQGLAAVVRQRWHPLATVRPGDELCWVALDAPQDPGNVGTILRTLDAVGGAGLILLGDATDPYHPAAVRASMGAICTQRLVRTTFADLCAWKQAHGYRLVGTAVTAIARLRRRFLRCPARPAHGQRARRATGRPRGRLRRPAAPPHGRPRRLAQPRRRNRRRPLRAIPPADHPSFPRKRESNPTRHSRKSGNLLPPPRERGPG